MTTEKIKLTGQLIDDPNPTILVVSEDIVKIKEVADEYKAIFPDIFLNAEWGYFKYQIPIQKKKAIINLLYVLHTPLNNLFSLM